MTVFSFGIFYLQAREKGFHLEVSAPLKLTNFTEDRFGKLTERKSFNPLRFSPPTFVVFES